MADDLVNRVTATTTSNFFKDFQDAVSKMAVEYWWAAKHGLFTYGLGGKDLQWRLRYQRGTPIGYSGGAEAQTFAVRNDYLTMTLGWRGVAHGIVITKQESWECKGKQEIIKLVPTLIADMKDDLLDRFGTDFYGSGTGLSSKTFHGLAASIGSGLNLTYAGQSQSTYSALQNQAIDGAGFSADPIAKFRSLKIACAKGQRGGRSRNQLDIFLCHSDEFETTLNHEDAKRSYVENSEMAEAGFENIVVCGTPLAWSEYATADTIFGLNSNLFEFPCATEQLFEADSEWTPGLPKLWLSYGLSHFNMLNKNPRGSGLIYSIT